MKFNENFMKDLEAKIEKYTDKDSVPCDYELESLNMLLTAYNGILDIEVKEAQLNMMSNSQEMMKNIDFSKVDFGGMLSKFLGK